MTPRSRRRLSLVLCILGVLLLGHGASAYLRAAWYWRQTMKMTPAPSEASSRVRPRSGDHIGVLEIPRLGVCLPIIEGDDENALSRGVGHLPDTALPWDQGNAALAGHRDTAFRPLSRIRTGDVIAVSAAGERYEYEVRVTRVVEPEDLSVLQDGATPSLTLITCHPFRMIGPAPRRFVVRAERIAASASRQDDCRDRGRDQ